MNKPFFSVIIPTYNRNALLKGAVFSVLEQTFKEFELIIVDDNSSDNTEKTIKEIKDKRIKYFKNKINLRTEENQKKAISLAKGEYIFTVGDDDFILWKDTLSKVKKLIEKHRYGFIRLNLIEKRFVGKGIRKSIINEENDIKIIPNGNKIQILDFFLKIAAGHWAGLVFKNRSGIANDIIDCRETEWIKILYEATLNHGAIFLGKYYMVISWSQAGILTHYDVPPDRRLMFENYTDYVSSILPKTDYKQYLHDWCKKFVLLQPAVKLYSTNKNMMKFNKRLFEIDPLLKYNPLFYIMFPLAFVVPKLIWKIIRVIQHKYKNHLTLLENYPQILSRFNYLDQKYFQ